jgi:hypothetical protein
VFETLSHLCFAAVACLLNYREMCVWRWARWYYKECPSTHSKIDFVVSGTLFRFCHMHSIQVQRFRCGKPCQVSKSSVPSPRAQWRRLRPPWSRRQPRRRGVFPSLMFSENVSIALTAGNRAGPGFELDVIVPILTRKLESALERTLPESWLRLSSIVLAS